MKTIVRTVSTLLIVCAVSPALAWKPKTHVYLAEQTLSDLANDTDLTLERVDYWAAPSPSRTRTPLGHFAADTNVARALQNHPSAFRAGVVGPDAYPDIMTGQVVIHPEDHDPHGRGADAWLEHIWTRAIASNNDEIIAFAAGFLTHAAGDMYAHTLVNHYAGGAFTYNPPDNARTHMIVESYIDTFSPDPNYDMTLSPAVHAFIYNEMVDATSGRTIRRFYDAKPGLGTITLPYMFSTLRDGLDEFAQWYRRRLRHLSRKATSGNVFARPAWAAVLAGFVATLGPIKLYVDAWIRDIDRGLRRWPEVSSAVAQAVLLNPANDCDSDRVKPIMDDYWADYVKSMLGVPDILVTISNFISDAIDLLIPQIDPFAALKDAVMDFIVEQATGYSLSDWKEFCSNPNAHIDARHRAEVDLQMNVSGGQFTWDSFAPAFNTVTMTKLLLMGDQGRTQVFQSLGYPAQHAPTALNAMLGFMKNLDADNEWDNHDDKMLMQRDCIIYQQLFFKQKGEHNDTMGHGPDVYEYRDSSQASGWKRCTAVASVSLAPFSATMGPFCGSYLEANVTLTDAMGPHGGLIYLDGDGVFEPPRARYVPAGDLSARFAVNITGVEAATTGQITAHRQGQTKSASFTVHPPRVKNFYVSEKFWNWGWQERFLSPNDAVLGNTPLAAEVDLDCDAKADGSRIMIEACPANGGPCELLAERVVAQSVNTSYRIPFDTPNVAQDTDYVLRARYGDGGQSYPLRILASRVRALTFTPEATTLDALGPTSADLLIELASDVDQGGETVSIDYYRGLSGPATVFIPRGRFANVQVTLPRAPITGCGGLIAAVTARSNLDPVSPPRARRGEIGLQYPESDLRGCYEWEAALADAFRLDAMLELVGEFVELINRRPEEGRPWESYPPLDDDRR